MSQDAADAVIIGAGHNSLACAVCLSQAGWRVHVVEQNAVPGGAVKTGEYTAPGFRHDWAAMNLSLFAGSAFFRQFGEKLGSDGAAFVSAKHCFFQRFPGRHLVRRQQRCRRKPAPGCGILGQGRRGLESHERSVSGRG